MKKLMMALAPVLFSIAALAGGVRYVATTGDDAANDGLSAAAPFLTITNAVASLGTDGGTVYVAAGTYTQMTQILLTNAVAVIGSTGNPSDVVISNLQRSSVKGLTPRDFYLNHASASVQNLTLTRGWVNGASGGCAYIDKAGGVLSNCVVSQGYAYNTYGRASGVYLDSATGLVTHCVISGCALNLLSSRKGIAMEVLSGGRVEDTLFVSNGFAGTYDAGSRDLAVLWVKQGAAVNCSVVGNAAPNLSGVILDAAGCATNCVMACNTNLFAEVDYVTNNVDPLVVITNTVAGNVPWAGSAANFVNCATDGDAAINDSCKVGTAATMFRDYAGGDYRPNEKRDGVLYDAGADVGKTAADLDLAGQSRVKDKAIDIGCYECPRSRVGGFVIYIQ